MSETPMTTDEMQRIADGIKRYLDMPKEVKAQIMQWKFSDAVDELTRSVIDFHERHATATRPDAVKNQAKAFAQEAGEVVWAIASGDLEEAAKEAADVLFTLIGVAMLAGITREQLAAAMRAIAAKNDEKTVANGWNWNARGTKVEKLPTAEPDAGSA
jgi:NTP pyrophosphatase (non-canonical NTP hydrolase)